MQPPNPKQPLSDIRIVDLTHYVAGPNCTRMLAAFGADVIKVERPDGGDPARRLGPFYKDEPHHEKSGLFMHLNGNKRGITLDLKSAIGVKILKAMIKEADVLVESFRPGVMKSLGLSENVLRQLNQRLIMTSISNFGQTGPYRDYKASELVLFGMGGPLQVTGMPEREPVKLGGRIVQYQAGAVAALLTMIAMWNRGDRGRGEYIDLSIMETQAGSMDRWVPMLVTYAYTGQTARRQPSIPATAGGIFPTSNGYVNTLNPSSPERMDRILDMIGRPEMMGDPRFTTLEERFKPENAAILDAAFLEWMLEHTTEEVVRESQARKVLAGPVHTPADLQRDPQLKARWPWVSVEHPNAARAMFPGRPMLLSETPWQLNRPAPLLGQHNREVYCDLLGYSNRDLQRLGRLGVI